MLSAHSYATATFVTAASLVPYFVVAATAANARLGKIQRSGSTLARDDRRLLTKVARTALRNTLLSDLHAA